MVLASIADCLFSEGSYRLGPWLGCGREGLGYLREVETTLPPELMLGLESISVATHELRHIFPFK